MEEYARPLDKVRITTLRILLKTETKVFGLLEVIYTGTRRPNAKEIAIGELAKIAEDLVEHDAENGFWWAMGEATKAPTGYEGRITPIICFKENGVIETPNEAAIRVFKTLVAREQAEMPNHISLETFHDIATTHKFYCAISRKWKPICLDGSEDDLKNVRSRTTHTDHYPKKRRPLEEYSTGDPASPTLGDLMYLEQRQEDSS